MPDRKEYIERGALIDRLDYYRDCFATEHDYDLAVATAEGTAIEDNVAEVVRCRECFYHDIMEKCRSKQPDFFCAAGKRKDGRAHGRSQ